MGDTRDYFADLLEKRDEAGSIVSGEPDLMFSEEAPVLPLQSSSEPVSTPAGLPALGPEETLSAMPNGPKLQPMGESRGKREARETQEIVEAVMSRFASGLQSVLENTNRHDFRHQNACLDAFRLAITNTVQQSHCIISGGWRRWRTAQRRSTSWSWIWARVWKPTRVRGRSKTPPSSAPFASSRVAYSSSETSRCARLVTS